MWAPETILRVLRERGELWQSAPGLVGLRGDALALLRRVERAIAALALDEAPDEWRLPPAIPLETLERADYFDSFPQWLTVAAHLRNDPAELERVARAASPSAAARDAVAPAGAALAPAVCYHVYAALAGTTVGAPPRLVTVQGDCWRHEGHRFVPLERGWAFTMREIVCIGTADDVRECVSRGLCRVSDFADALGLSGTIVQAADPFFAPTARGKALLQRAKGLKRELLLPLAPGHSLAAASFNHHETFFGTAFGIRLPDGTPAATGCLAFGLERWLLAILCAHGPDPAGWPTLTVSSSAALR